jgi:hypothetical protein
VENRAVLAAMRPAARAAAGRYSWERYGDRLTAVIAGILGGGR